MKIKNTMQAALNKQINIELSSSYSYLSLAGWFETTPFKGFARWMQRHSADEQVHAMKLFRYIKDRIGFIDLFPIQKPKQSFNSPLEAFNFALEMEKNCTESIYSLYSLALEEADHETKERLHWFLQEQIHEEKHVQDMTDKVALADKKPVAILHLDAHATEQY